MIILVSNTQSSINPSVALDNYFGSYQAETKNWLKKLKYSYCLSKNTFQEEYNPLNNTKTHIVTIGIDKLQIGNKKNIIIYPFDKFSVIKNELIKGILLNQLLLDKEL